MNRQILREESLLARTIALPAEHKPLRYPGFPAMEKTSVLALKSSSNLAVATGVSTKVIVCRQPYYPLWITQAGLFNWSFLQWTLAVDSTNGTSVCDHEFPIADTHRTNTNLTATTSRIGTTGFAGTSAYPVMGIDGSQQFQYAAGSVVVVGSLVSPGAVEFGNCTLTFTYSIWVAPGVTEDYDFDFSISSGATSFSFALALANPTWIRPKRLQINGTITGPSLAQSGSLIFVMDSAMNMTTTVTPATTSTCALITHTTNSATNHLVPVTIGNAEFLETVIPWKATRVTALSLLATNVTNIQNKGGTVLCCRVNPRSSDVFSFTEAGVNSVHPSERAYLALETGYYTYVPPSGDMMDFRDYTCVMALTTTPAFRLDNDALSHVAFFTNTSSNATMAMSLDLHFEFRNTLALFQVGMSRLTLESLHQAQLDLCAKGYFFENFTHTKILRALSNIASGGVKMMRILDPRADMALRAASWAARRVGWVSGASAPQNPKSTSAQASGWLGPSRAKSSKTNKKGKSTKKQIPPPAKKKGGLQMYLDSKR